jgi:putative hydrolase of the HAD superfamily
MIRRLLVDYGEVISTRLPDETITDLAALAGRPRAAFLDRYWHHRPAYDLGQPAAEYWSQVLDRDLSEAPRVVNQLTNIDVYGWLRLNLRTLPVLLGHVRRTGSKLALLSNAPEPLAEAIDVLGWSQHFDHRYYSCRLGAAKPDPQAFRLVLSDLGVRPGEVLFIDDRAENTRAARDLAMHTVTFTSAAALDCALRLSPVAVGPTQAWRCLPGKDRYGLLVPSRRRDREAVRRRRVSSRSVPTS